GDAQVPYALLARLLRALRPSSRVPMWARQELARLLPEWGALPPGRLNPLHLRSAAAAVLAEAAGGPTPLILVVDDLHFADSATLEALAALIAETGPCVRWLLGSRSAAESTAALATCIAALAALDAPRVVQVELAPLDAEGVYALI